jgi:hypothetical protein
LPTQEWTQTLGEHDDLSASGVSDRLDSGPASWLTRRLTP